MEDRLHDLIDYLNEQGYDKAISIDHTDPFNADTLDEHIKIDAGLADNTEHRIRHGIILDQPVLEANAPTTVTQYGTTEHTTITNIGPGDEIFLYSREQINRFVQYNTSIAFPTYIGKPGAVIGVTNPVYHVFLKAAHETGFNTYDTHNTVETERLDPTTIANTEAN